MISVSGQGNEPKLEFSSTLIEFGPVLPHSAGDEKEVIVRNPSSFPVEIYSLEFDKQYLDEEKVWKELRSAMSQMAHLKTDLVFVIHL